MNSMVFKKHMGTSMEIKERCYAEEGFAVINASDCILQISKFTVSKNPNHQISSKKTGITPL